VNHLLRAVWVEWPFLRIRLLRSRLGLWLLLLAGSLLWLERGGPPPAVLDLAVRAGGYAAVLCVCYLAGSAADRAAVVLPLLHGATPGAVAVGRWLAATAGAQLVVLAVTGPVAWTGALRPAVGAAFAGGVTASAVAAVSLALVWTGGNVAGAMCLLWLLLFGQVRPEAVLGLPHPGSLRELLAGFMAVVPGLWRYRAIAHADPGALVHAAVWTVVGLLAARRRGARLGMRF
jgi:hypothetical protein